MKRSVQTNVLIEKKSSCFFFSARDEWFFLIEWGMITCKLKETWHKRNDLEDMKSKRISFLVNEREEKLDKFLPAIF